MVNQQSPRSRFVGRFQGTTVVSFSKRRQQKPKPADNWREKTQPKAIANSLVVDTEKHKGNPSLSRVYSIPIPLLSVSGYQD